MALFNPSRDEVRQFFFEAWRKFGQSLELTPLEGMALQVMMMHPEYHAELGETNPFLHMSLHLSILEQISINQPPGIAPSYQALLEKHAEEHAAQHDLMDCLAETVWRAQRDGKAPDAMAYLECMQQKAR